MRSLNTNEFFLNYTKLTMLAIMVYIEESKKKRNSSKKVTSSEDRTGDFFRSTLVFYYLR